jgi:hypothetical protein
MDFSESMFLKSQGLGWNETSAVGGTGTSESSKNTRSYKQDLLSFFFFGAGTLWDEIYDGVYFSATTWKTIDKGLNRLAEAFHPIVDKKITYGRRVNKLSYDESSKKTSVHWYDNAKSSSETLTYDKTIVAVPFSVARLWRLPKFNPVMTEAITGLGYSYACKVAVSGMVSAAYKSPELTFSASSASIQDSILGADRGPHLWWLRIDRLARHRFRLLPRLQHQRYRSRSHARQLYYSRRTLSLCHV